MNKNKMTLDSLVTGRLQRPLRIVIHGVDGIGKALAHGTPVLTPEGFKPIENIAVGESVISVDGLPTNVIGVYPQQEKTLYRVVFDDGTSTVCCGEHLWKVYSYRDRKEQRDGAVMTTERLMESLYFGKTRCALNYSIPMADPISLDSKDVLADPYLIGAWLGDGSKGAPCLNKPYKEFHEELVKIAPNATVTKAGVYIKSLRGPLEQLGLMHLGSHERFIPDAFKFNDIKTRLATLQGLLDTDGYTSTNGTVVYTSTSKRLALDVIWLVQSLGGLASLSNKSGCFYNDEDGKRVMCKDAYNVVVGHHNISSLFRANLMKRQRALLAKPRESRYYTRFIKYIEQVDSGLSTCIRVEHPSRLFLVNDCIVTHNSTFAAAAPDPIFLCAEDGTAHLDVTRFPQPENWKDIMDAFSTLYEAEHSFKTLVLDSVDWAEHIARDAVCIENNVPSIENIPYGRGWVFCNDKMRQLISCLDAIYMKGMNVIVIAHSHIKPFNDPELPETIDRYALKLDKRTDPLFREWADYVLFANWDTRLDQKTDRQGKPLPGLEGKAKAKSYGKRLLFTQRSAAFDAKRRFAIPDRLELDWNLFWSAHHDAAGSTGNLDL